MDKLYTIFETSLLLHVSESTLYRWVHQKRIEYVKIGSRVLFTDEMLNNYIKKNTVTAE